PDRLESSGAGVTRRGSGYGPSSIHRQLFARLGACPDAARGGARGGEGGAERRKGPLLGRRIAIPDQPSGQVTARVTAGSRRGHSAYRPGLMAKVKGAGRSCSTGRNLALNV